MCILAFPLATMEKLILRTDKKGKMQPGIVHNAQVQKQLSPFSLTFIHFRADILFIWDIRAQ